MAVNFNELFRLSNEEDGVSVDKVAGDVNGQLRVKVSLLFAMRFLAFYRTLSIYGKMTLVGPGAYDVAGWALRILLITKNKVGVVCT